MTFPYRGDWRGDYLPAEDLAKTPHRRGPFAANGPTPRTPDEERAMIASNDADYAIPLYPQCRMPEPFTDARSEARQAVRQAKREQRAERRAARERQREARRRNR